MTDTDVLLAAMKQEFGADERRIEHAMCVLAYAKRIHGREGGDRGVVLAAAVLHDIGIQEAERKHGSNAPKYQEIEGPPIARRILERLGLLDSRGVDHVCRIVGSHHSARDVDTCEFRIVWDADWLVNFREVYPCEYGIECETRGEQCMRRINRIFRTSTGLQIAEEVLLPVFAAEGVSPLKDDAGR